MKLNEFVKAHNKAFYAIAALIFFHILLSAVFSRFNNRIDFPLTQPDIQYDTFNFYPLVTADDPTNTPFRWSYHKSGIIFRGLTGNTDYKLSLYMRARRDTPEGRYFRVQVDDKIIYEGELSLNWEWYEMSIPSELIDRDTVCPVIYAKPRVIEKPYGKLIRGVRVSHARLEAAAKSGLAMPPVGYVYYSALYFLLLGVILSLGGVRFRNIMIALGVLNLLFHSLLLTPLRSFSFNGIRWLALNAAFVLLFAIALNKFLPVITSKTGFAGTASTRKLTLISSISLLLKSGLWFIPVTSSIDFKFHFHMYSRIIDESVFQLSHAGGLKFPYPPLFYLLVYPFDSLFGETQIVMKVIFAICIGLTPVLVYLFALKFFKDEKTALIASLIYVCIPKDFYIYLLGIIANGFGHFMTLLAILLTLYLADKLDRPMPFIILTVVYSMTMLSHFGAMLSFMLFVVVFIILVVIRDILKQESPSPKSDEQMTVIQKVFFKRILKSNSSRIITVFFTSSAIVFFSFYLQLLKPTLRNIAKLLVRTGGESDGMLYISSHRLMKVGQNIIAKFGLFPFLLMIAAVLIFIARRQFKTKYLIIYAWFGAYLVQLYLVLSNKFALRFELFILPLSAILTAHMLKRINKPFVSRAVIAFSLLIALYLWVMFNLDISRIGSLIIPHKDGSWILW